MLFPSFEYPEPILESYDWIVVNSSAGKDSQAMLDVIAERTGEAGVSSRVVVVHADLGRVEWPGTKELARRQADHYGFRFEVVARRQDDLLEHVRKRGRWPSSGQRYCTSDHKRGPIRTLFTRLARESRKTTCRILNCMGMRADESPKRAKLPPFEAMAEPSNGRKQIDNWLPIHPWTVGQVWERNRRSGVPHHPAYDLGMPRLSCMFCIFSPKSALMLAGKHNRELLDEYVEVERQIGHDFRHKFPIASVAAALDAGEDVGPIQDWAM